MYYLSMDLTQQALQTIVKLFSIDIKTIDGSQSHGRPVKLMER